MMLKDVNARYRFRIVLLGTCCMLALAVVGARLVLCMPDEGRRPDGKTGEKRFSRVLVEGLQISKHGYYGIDFVKCGSCRLEKRRKGFLTFGGLNVLVIDDLQVVLPPKTKDDEVAQADARQGGSEPQTIARSLGVSEGFLSSQGIPCKFSGLYIKALSVNRLSDDGQCVEKVFSAESADAVRKGLSLSGCTIFANRDSGEFVGDAMLTKSGGNLRLAWHGGEMRL